MKRWKLVVLTLAAAAVLGAQEEVLKVPEQAARDAAVKKQVPAYPPIAKQMKITGKVTLDVVISADGTVEKCEALVGNPILTSPAINAVKEWTFKPFASGGRNMRAATKLTFSFGI